MSTQVSISKVNVSCKNLEPYVSVGKAAQYLDIKPKTLLEKARKGEIPAYPWGTGARRTWRFKISQIDAWMNSRFHPGHSSPEADAIEFAQQTPRDQLDCEGKES